MSKSEGIPNVSKGYEQVRKNDRRYGTYKDCNNCVSYLFDECQNPEVAEQDIVYAYGRTYCTLFKEKT